MKLSASSLCGLIARAVQDAHEFQNEPLDVLALPPVDRNHATEYFQIITVEGEERAFNVTVSEVL